MCDNLPTEDDGTTGTNSFKRQQERNILQNKKSQHRQGGFQHRFPRLLEFGWEAKVPLDPETIFCSCCQVTKLRPYTTFFCI